MAVHRNDRRGASFSVDTDDLKALVRDLRRAGPAASRGMRRAVKASAEIVAVEARSRASEHSQSIPPTIKANAYLSATTRSLATVTAGRGVPLAALYELGNKGKNVNSTTFKHPVFERDSSGKLQPTDKWATQPRYPFLLPAAEAKGAEVTVELERVAKLATDIIAIKKDL